MVMRNQFIIRDYHKGDFQSINDLWQKTGLGDASRGDDDKVIENSITLGGKMLVMEERGTGKIVGTSWMTFDGRRIHFHHFGIHPEFQGRKLSGLLLKNTLLFAKEKGYQIKLEVHRNNLKALRLYQKAGFTSLGDLEVYIIRNIKDIDTDQIFKSS
jgi:ribosomal protein S18 acetylase RimI-like enzyme